jgi:hypothetical protein
VPKRLNTQSAGPVRFLIFCSISIFLLASLATGWQPNVQLAHSSRECIPPDLSTGISNPPQPAQVEVVLGQLSMYLASWVCTIELVLDQIVNAPHVIQGIHFCRFENCPIMTYFHVGVHIHVHVHVYVRVRVHVHRHLHVEVHISVLCSCSCLNFLCFLQLFQDIDVNTRTRTQTQTQITTNKSALSMV